VATIYRGKVGARMRPYAGPRTRQSKHAGRVTVRARGGPFHGHRLCLSVGTLPFRTKQAVGIYGSCGRWFPAR
jgi:hypothetical protein